MDVISSLTSLSLPRRHSHTPEPAQPPSSLLPPKVSHKKTIQYGQTHLPTNRHNISSIPNLDPFSTIPPLYPNFSFTPSSLPSPPPPNPRTVSLVPIRSHRLPQPPLPSIPTPRAQFRLLLLPIQSTSASQNAPHLSPARQSTPPSRRSSFPWVLVIVLVSSPS
jgi:hypothetical protein